MSLQNTRYKTFSSRELHTFSYSFSRPACSYCPQQCPPFSAADPRCVVRDRCKARPPCLNGGTCSPSAESGREYTCTCSPAWRGQHCQEPSDPCTTALNRSAAARHPGMALCSVHLGSSSATFVDKCWLEGTEKSRLLLRP